MTKKQSLDENVLDSQTWPQWNVFQSLLMCKLMFFSLQFSLWYEIGSFNDEFQVSVDWPFVVSGTYCKHDTDEDRRATFIWCCILVVMQNVSPVLTLFWLCFSLHQVSFGNRSCLILYNELVADLIIFIRPEMCLLLFLEMSLMRVLNINKTLKLQDVQ